MTEAPVIEPTDAAAFCDEHSFGRHSDTCDPWDALLCDVETMEGEADHWASSLVTYWARVAHERQR